MMRISIQDWIPVPCDPPGIAAVSQKTRDGLHEVPIQDPGYVTLFVNHYIWVSKSGRERTNFSFSFLCFGEGRLEITIEVILFAPIFIGSETWRLLIWLR